MAQLKRRAAQQGTSVSKLVEQAVRLVVRTPRTPTAPQAFELVTFGKGGASRRTTLTRRLRCTRPTTSAEPFGLSDVVLSGFLRIVNQSAYFRASHADGHGPGLLPASGGAIPWPHRNDSATRTRLLPLRNLHPPRCPTCVYKTSDSLGRGQHLSKSRPQRASRGLRGGAPA